jgi:hypothetical protein
VKSPVRKIFTPGSMRVEVGNCTPYSSSRSISFIRNFQYGYNKGMATKTRSIQPVVKISSLRDQKSDFEYWQSRPFGDRLSALEEIRAEYHRWRGNAQSRLQRVYSITKR